MRQFLIALLFFSLIPAAHAWNAGGHRLIAVIAWQQLSGPSQSAISHALEAHPDYQRWVKQAHSSEALAIFAEAATWPDDIRNDPRFYDEARESPMPALPGLTDTARHKRWHYVDLDRAGRTRTGELDQQIGRIADLLRSTRNNDEIAYFLPWLIHLIGDIHQPLHVGLHGDEGGNQVEIENPFNPRLPISSLHLYWDDLPAPPWLRGRRLEKQAAQLLASNQAPRQADIAAWRDESHRLLKQAYPRTNGSLLPLITEDFHRQSHALADQQIINAGYRLGRLLEAIFAQRVPRETH